MSTKKRKEKKRDSRVVLKVNFTSSSIWTVKMNMQMTSTKLLSKLHLMPTKTCEIHNTNTVDKNKKWAP